MPSGQEDVDAVMSATSRVSVTDQNRIELQNAIVLSKEDRVALCPVWQFAFSESDTLLLANSLCPSRLQDRAWLRAHCVYELCNNPPQSQSDMVPQVGAPNCRRAKAFRFKQSTKFWRKSLFHCYTLSLRTAVSRWNCYKNWTFYFTCYFRFSYISTSFQSKIFKVYIFILIKLNFLLE